MVTPTSNKMESEIVHFQRSNVLLESILTFTIANRL